MVCSTCGIDKPETDFYLKRSGDPLAGRRARCKRCSRPTSTPARRARAAKWARDWRQSNPEANWARYLKTYGVTPEWYEKQLARQGGGCAVCGQKCPTGKRLSIDHDHRCCQAPPLCGQCNRGLLCRGCNVGIGNLGDDPDRLESAARYLRGH